MGLGDKIKRAWNAFQSKDEDVLPMHEIGYSSFYKPDRYRLRSGAERSIVVSVYNRIAIDVATVKIHHVRLDEQKRFLEIIDSGLDNCLNIEANIDQTGRAFIQDVAMSMMDEGVVAIVPVDTTSDPRFVGSYDINSMRTGKIIDWYPQHVRVRVYDERSGEGKEIVLPKKSVAILENPLYHIMNEPNSTMQRLIRKLALLDLVDEQSSSTKMDLIIQLPYIIKTKAMREQADRRRAAIEEQLRNSKYGIAYTDGTEKITQLSKPLENNLLEQVKFLTQTLYDQLGITAEILNGTADEKAMLNYYARTIEPIVSLIVDGMIKSFLTKTARTQRQSIMAFRDPFKLVPTSVIAEMADTFARNEILSSNEIRQIIGMKPSNDPKADELRNSNMPHADDYASGEDDDGDMTHEEYEEAMQALDESDNEIDDIEQELEDDIEHSDLLYDEDYLAHYASPYYDPVKAHEYYMRTRQLKGRRPKLNDRGKEALKYVKDSIRGEQKSKSEKMRSDYKKAAEKRRSDRKARSETHRANVKAMTTSIRSNYKSKIESLNAKLKGMSKEERKEKAAEIKEEKARLRDKVKSDLTEIRNKNKEERQRITDEYRNSSKFASTEYKSARTKLKDDYKKKLDDEENKIYSDSSFVKPDKPKKKGR